MNVTLIWDNGAVAKTDAEVLELVDAVITRGWDTTIKISQETILWAFCAYMIKTGRIKTLTFYNLDGIMSTTKGNGFNLVPDFKPPTQLYDFIFETIL